MNLWPWRRKTETRAIYSSADPWDKLRGLFGVGFETEAGVSINEDNALSISTVYACVRVLAETMATLPLKVYDVQGEQGQSRRATPGTPYYRLLHDAPNDYQTSFMWRETAMCHVLLWGNAYSLIVRNGRGNVLSLVQQDPWRVRVEMERGRLRYVIDLDDGGVETVPPENMLHIRAMSTDGICGIRPLMHWKHAMGLAQATETFGSRFFANDSRPGVFIEMPGKLTFERQQALQKDFEDKYSGLGKSHRALIGEQGMKIHTVMIPPEDAQFLETRKFQVAEICRVFRVPPHMVSDLEKATFSNIEHQDLAFSKHTITPWARRWEQEINSKLFPFGRSFAEFDLNGLLRGDFKSRMEGYQVAVGRPFMAPNEARRLENMEPIAGLDEPALPLNMTTDAEAGAEVENNG